jgi:hypothetical protein
MYSQIATAQLKIIGPDTQKCVNNNGQNSE